MQIKRFGGAGPAGERMKKILITNDDGIQADGLIRLAKAARAFGEVWVVAPDRQKSAAAHSITLHSPVDVCPCDFPAEDVRAFSCTGTPADCVRIGIRAILPAKPDLVLAGINYGYNVGSDIQYSATAGGAFEAAFQGITGIAFSEDASFCHETTDVFLHKVLEELADKKLDEAHIWNVNFPGCAADECRGILYNRTVSRREIYDDSYQVVGELPGGGTRYMVNGRYQEEAEPETDFRAVLDHYVSIGTVTNVG